MSALTRLANVFRSQRLDAELDEEMRFHIEEQIEQLMAAGMPRKDAAALANRRFGNRLLLRETSHELKAARSVESILGDVRFGWRVIWKDRGAMSAAALSLALAMGACATAFSLIDALILRPLPVAHAERLFYLAWPDPQMRTPPGIPKERMAFSYPVFQHLCAAAGPDLDLFGANWSLPLNPVIFDPASGERELVRVATLSGNGFRVLGVNATRGRLFNDGDDSLSAPPVMVLSEAFFKRRFGGDPAVIGRLATFGDRPFQIIGVVESKFTGLQPGILNDAWIPLAAMYSSQTIHALDLEYAGIWGHSRLGDHRAEQALDAAFRNYRRDHVAQLLTPGAPAERVAQYVGAPLLFHHAPAGADSIFRLEFTRPLWMAGVLCALLLVIAASNVANLFLARAASREREMALRIAIGAGRWRLMRQLLIESGVLSAAACAGGLAMSAIAAPFLAGQLGASTLPSYLDVHPDWRLVIFIGVAGVVTTLFFGAAPAWRASAVHPDSALKSSAKQSARTNTLRVLLPVQVAFSFAMLFLSGLLVTSFSKLIHVDLGFAQDHVILFTVNTVGLDTLRQRPLILELVERVRQSSGVREACMSAQGPIGGNVMSWVAMPFIRFPGRETEKVRPVDVAVSPGFFKTMQIPLLKGREFDLRDVDADTASAAIVNDAFAQRFFPGQNPIGRLFELIGDEKPVAKQIVGVVANSLFYDLHDPVVPTIYSPLRSLNGAVLEVRTAGNPLALAGMLRRTIESVHPAVRVRASILQSARIDDTLTMERLLAWLGGFFAIAAIVLAGVGLYGVIAYSVVRRTKEIGIRMALGAQRAAVVRSVIGDAARLICLGIAAGMGGGLALARYVTTLLFEVKPVEFWSLASPLICLLAASIAAAIRPAVRAARVDPAVALRYE